MTFQNLQELLESRAETSTGKIISYTLGDARQTTYAEILKEVNQKSNVIRSLDTFQPGSVVLLHLSDQLEQMVWFWSILYAGGLAAMSTPFSNNSNQRILHIKHLSEILKHPLCITSEEALDQFSGQRFLAPTTIDSLGRDVNVKASNLPREAPSPEDTALLMLTSGSTGNAKAVCLSHGQLLAAVAGKSSVLALPQEGSFLNWIAMDHVASLVEIHLQALFLNVDQVHIQAVDIIVDPIEFIRLIDKHRVSRTFAPNFFLATLRSALEKLEEYPNWDLSCLRYLASGGEANRVETCAAVTNLLQRFGAPERTIVPGFGMTETCAGSIFNSSCPSHEIENNLEFASVGHCMTGIEMRIAVSPQDEASEVGDLEVKGPVVFKEYFNNASETTDAFTQDGWFRTGDRAFIDSAGHLNLVGRRKETVVVNGVKYSPEEIEWAIEEAAIRGATPSFTVCFSSLRKGSSTETIHVVYLPTYPPDDDTSIHVDTLNAIMKVVMTHTGSRPEVLPVDRAALHKSTLGKLSRTKIKQSFEKGDYSPYEDANRERMHTHRHLDPLQPALSPPSPKEEGLRQVFASALQLKDYDCFEVTTPIFEMGITSIELIRLKRNIEEYLELSSPIPLITLMTNPTIRSLLAALDADSVSKYEPVVEIQPHGTKTPLWLVHPGVGEVLVFLNLAKYLPDRPVYAFRARGFNKGEPYFADIGDAITTYHAAIKRRQPSGPYALAGYSYGSMLAFETAKLLESNGDEVSFLGVFNLPPHIKSRMRQLSWMECILHLSYFLDLIGEKLARDLAAELHQAPREEVLATVLTWADPNRLAELALTPIALVNWANLAYSLQSMAVDYEPAGSVARMDVFYCTPLAVVAASREQWLGEHLSKWTDFVREGLAFHEVNGEHYTMMGKDHVLTFQKTLRDVLTARGL